MRTYYRILIEAIDDSMLSIPPMTDFLADNLLHLESRISAACARSGRPREEVQILLATKTVPPERLKIALKKGYSLFGENTAQELVKKQSALAGNSIDWQFIGRLQSNKVKDVLPICSLIHSLDLWSLAEEIQKRADKNVNVLIEIHSSQETSKTGIAPEALVDFVQKLETLDKLTVCGVMTIADNSTNPEDIRVCFRKTREAFSALKKANLKNTRLRYLSMGMSGDFELAIEEGSTLLRIGSLVFGDRAPK